jgi:hypothetical protein
MARNRELLLAELGLDGDGSFDDLPTPMHGNYSPESSSPSSASDFEVSQNWF